jgi:hypothetical protein
VRKSIIFEKKSIIFEKNIILRPQGQKTAEIKKIEKITEICIKSIFFTNFHLYITFFEEIKFIFQFLPILY